MANTAQKSLIRSNATRLKALAQVILATNAVFAVIRGGVFYSSFSKSTFAIWMVLCLMYAGPFWFLRSVARPTYSNGNLVDGGEDLCGPGLVEYAHDTIYLTALTHVGFIFSSYSVLLLSLIPIYGAYAIFTGFCRGSPSDEAHELVTDETSSLSGLSRKERRKAERGKGRSIKEQ